MLSINQAKRRKLIIWSYAYSGFVPTCRTKEREDQLLATFPEKVAAYRAREAKRKVLREGVFRDGLQ